ncbi:unnamed protein product [Caenorhabditis angaria]|uniref:Uncharacterized protein n=1 Tax=Caenorhabditis angaria TaxID=860376 RepID=A0A9P1IBL8_9PELO|nr:unnamed protein product [Caenorhabditis angaria]
MSARDAMAAMLDELMGPKRNVKLGEDTKVTFDDPEICAYYLVGFCPHEMFVNTKADLGACTLVHDDNLRRMYPTSEEFRKIGFEKRLLRYLVHLEEDNNRRIRKNKEKLMGMDHLGKNKNNEEQTRTKKDIELIEADLKIIIREAEEAGNNGNVTKCQELVAKCEEYQTIKAQLSAKLEQLIADANPSLQPQNNDEMSIKPMEVCEICGSMLIVNDAQNRIDEHLTGKMHTGFQKIRTMIEELRNILKKQEEEDDSKREERRRDRKRSSSRERNREKRRRSRSRSRSRSPNRNRYDRDRRDRRGYESSSSSYRKRRY